MQVVVALDEADVIALWGKPVEDFLGGGLPVTENGFSDGVDSELMSPQQVTQLRGIVQVLEQASSWTSAQTGEDLVLARQLSPSPSNPAVPPTLPAAGAESRNYTGKYAES